MQNKIECTVPVLPVKSLKDSIRFYTDSLGFQVDWGGEEGKLIGSVSRDGCTIMLSEMHGEKKPTYVWIGLTDDSLFAEYMSKDIKVVQEPLNQTWAYNMKIEDIDGNVLWLGTAPKTDIPFSDQADG